MMRARERFIFEFVGAVHEPLFAGAEARTNARGEGGGWVRTV